VKIVDVTLSEMKIFYDKFDLTYQAGIHPGEKEALTFLFNAPESYLLCSADKVVFKVLGLLGRSEQGISLEEILGQIGLYQKLEERFTKQFREKYTKMGQIDAIQNFE
jgi:hypothetical protein